MRLRRKLFGNCIHGITLGLLYRCVTSTVTITFVACERAPRLLCAEGATEEAVRLFAESGCIALSGKTRDDDNYQ